LSSHDAGLEANPQIRSRLGSSSTEKIADETDVTMSHHILLRPATSVFSNPFKVTTVKDEPLVDGMTFEGWTQTPLGTQGIAAPAFAAPNNAGPAVRHITGAMVEDGDDVDIDNDSIRDMAGDVINVDKKMVTEAKFRVMSLLMYNLLRKLSPAVEIRTFEEISTEMGLPAEDLK
jgi:hypothetical protein